MLLNNVSLLIRILFINSIVFFSACTVVGPDYKEPDTEWLNQWTPSVYSSEAQVTNKKNLQEMEFWWTLFNDPTLNQLIKLAKKENTVLKIAGLRIFESRALLGLANSSLYPQLQEINGGAQYVNKQYHGGNATDTSQSFVSYQTGLNIGWELDFWGRFKRGIESADAAYLASISHQRDMQVLIAAQVAHAYFNYRAIEARIVIAKKNAKILKRSYEITESLYTSGEGSELDLQQAKTQYLSTLSTIPDLEIQLLQTRNAISVLLGEAPGQLEVILSQSNDYNFPTLTLDHFQGIPANSLLRRPDIRTAAWQIATQSAQIGVAQADYYPAITLVGSLTWSANNLSGSSDIAGFNFGPGFSWNILDYNRVENNVRIQDARLQQLIESYHNLVIQAAKEVDDAAYSLLKTYEKQSLVDKTVKASERALSIANIRYREGYADFQRVLDAQQAMFSQAERQLSNRQAQVTSVINLYKSLGGGWSKASTNELIPESTHKMMQERTDWGDLLEAPIYYPDKNIDTISENNSKSNSEKKINE